MKLIKINTIFTFLLLTIYSHNSSPKIYATDPSNIFVTDTDGDGIDDINDLDDDNDGILDSDEGACGLGVIGNGTSVPFPSASSGTITDGTASANYNFTRNTSPTLLSGYSGVSYNGSTEGIEIVNNSSSQNPDKFSYTLNVNNVTAGYKAIIRLYQVNNTTSGNDEASDWTINFNGTGNAIYQDNITPSSSIYRYSPPSNFNQDNRQIEGIDTSGDLISGGKLRIYAIKNSDANWFVEFPKNSSSITINKAVLNSAVSSTQGIGNKFPQLGFHVRSGESFTEWLSFRVLFVKCDFDTDGDGTPDYLDTDSDNDGCPDAIEASGNIEFSNLNSNFSIAGNVDTNGVPIIVNGGQQNNNDVVNANSNNGCLADLSLTQLVNKPILKGGQSTLVTIHLKNDGPNQSSGIKVKNLLPTGFTFQALGSVIPINTNYNYSTNIWDLTNISILSGQTVTIQLSAIVSSAGLKVFNAEISESYTIDIDSVPNNVN